MYLVITKLSKKKKMNKSTKSKLESENIKKA